MVDRWMALCLSPRLQQISAKAARHTLDLTLYTIEPDKRRRYVANIYELECLK